MAAITAEEQLDRDLATRLLSRHGTEASGVVGLGQELDLLRPLDADTPHLEAEVAWAVRREAALNLDDILSRRFRLTTVRRDRCASIAPRVAEIAGAELGWDEAEQRRQVETFLAGARREYDVPEDAAGTEVAAA